MGNDAQRRAAFAYNAASDFYDASPLGFWNYFGRKTIERLSLQNGSRVLDACCGAGASALSAAELVGPKGKVIGIDIKKIEPLTKAFFIQGNIQDEEIINSILKFSNSSVDVVLSDLSPNVSGNWDLDHARQIDLTRTALKLSNKILKKDGKVVLKVFQGDMLNELIDELKKEFKKIIITKPNASRQTSSEIYLICIGKL